MVTPLKLGFQFHFELGEIGQVPVCEFPCAIFLPWLMFDSNDQVHSIIAHLVCTGFCLE
jgi:hypothetical protein